MTDHQERLADVLRSVTWPDGEPYIRMARAHVLKLAAAVLDSDVIRDFRQRQARIDRANAGLQDFLSWCDEDPSNFTWFESHHPELVARLRSAVLACLSCGRERYELCAVCDNDT